MRTILCYVLLTLILADCGGSNQTPAPAEGVETMSLKLTSPVFDHEAAIPVKYTCDGQDVSPPLVWAEPPAETQSFTLIMDDPDAPVGTWDHWILFNLPPDTRQLPEAAAPPPNSTGGNNSWQRAGYGGPCPPGGTHRYFFKLYALDTRLELAEGATKDAVLKAMDGHILGQSELMGTYTRQK